MRKHLTNHDETIVRITAYLTYNCLTAMTADSAAKVNLEAVIKEVVSAFEGLGDEVAWVLKQAKLEDAGLGLANAVVQFRNKER